MGDEGGFAPNLKSNEEAIQVVLEAITQAGYSPATTSASRSTRRRVNFTTPRARSYVFKKSDKSERDSDEMAEFWANWVRQYPIISLEDGMAEDDWEGWKFLTDLLGKKIQLVGDDHVRHQHAAFVARHQRGHRQFDSD